ISVLRAWISAAGAGQCVRPANFAFRNAFLRHRIRSQPVLRIRIRPGWCRRGLSSATRSLLPGGRLRRRRLRWWILRESQRCRSRKHETNEVECRFAHSRLLFGQYLSYPVTLGPVQHGLAVTIFEADAQTQGKKCFNDSLLGGFCLFRAASATASSLHGKVK